ncbi:phosphotransferase [Berryella wangjianweii]|uniref:Phosphotransferase n=1 Tax=Berryella wangjianweii TaxID=2734634 RepID=A0A6M8J628_9ACTN|nr:NTP transferase domain-containing protein [Berryella wangjianweii]QKF06919.1 phosphotransferase [Berryella wangjianweii]
MLSFPEFSVLSSCAVEPGRTQRSIAEATELSVGLVNATVRSLRTGWLLDDAGALTPAGMRALEPHRVRNAVILAAGMSTRFAPVSYDTPKGLLTVRGEVLIERQIRQLRAAGIDDVTVVVGHMKEKFFYLGDEFGVSIVVNPDYAERNNTSSIMCAADRIDSTFICSCDNYFVQNPFEPYAWRAYYAATYHEGPTQEYCLRTKTKHRRIVDVTVGGEDSWIMMGHAYWDPEFSASYLRFLRAEYDHAATASKLWEDLYAERICALRMDMRPFAPGMVWEFDSIEELSAFDPTFVEDVDCPVFDNICEVLNCAKGDIRRIEPIKEGLTNLSFRFEVGEDAYVYRHPGPGSNELINRASEAFSQGVASQLGLDTTYLHEDPAEGWKVSRFLEGCATLDYDDRDQVAAALGLLRRLHDHPVDSGFDFDVYAATLETIELIDHQRRVMFRDFTQMTRMAEELAALARAHGARRCLCHNDSYAPNFLVHPGGIDLIDWEYSGMSDYASDLGTFICCSQYTVEQAREVLQVYFGRPLEPVEEFHCLAYCCLSSYYWFIWALYKEVCGDPVGSYLYLWYRHAKGFGEEARQRAAELGLTAPDVRPTA